MGQTDRQTSSQNPPHPQLFPGHLDVNRDDAQATGTGLVLAPEPRKGSLGASCRPVRGGPDRGQVTRSDSPSEPLELGSMRKSPVAGSRAGSRRDKKLRVLKTCLTHLGRHGDTGALPSTGLDARHRQALSPGVLGVPLVLGEAGACRDPTSLL